MPFALLLAAIIVIPILFGVMKIGSGARSFQKMGDIRGKPMTAIIAQVGSPTSVSAAANGGQLYQWMKLSGRSGFHYAILADAEGKAVGFTHQFVR